MYLAKGIAISDGKNRKNHILPLETLINAYHDTWNMPMVLNLGHDRSKPIGYTLLEGIYMEPGKAYLVNESHFPENADEQKKLIQMVNTFDVKKFCMERKEEVDKLFSLLGEDATPRAKVAPTGQAVAIIDDGIVERVFPDIQESLHGGLINLKELSPVYKGNGSCEDNRGMLVPGVYRKGQFLLFAHSFFRRNLCIANTINDAFFETFEKLRQNKNLELKVAIDRDMIGLAGSESLELEYQYWWGPKFNDDLSSIPEGVTCYKNEHYDNLFTNIIETQFYWHLQDDIFTFECEEICDKENALINGNAYFGCRYVHSMIDKSTELPYHLDGAVRLYTDEQILERMDDKTNISKYGKKSLYLKLWRIDSDFDVSIWKELITHYFRDNQLIGEYFGGVDEKYSQIKVEKQTRYQNRTKNAYIPVELNKGDGLRMYFRYCNMKEIPFIRDALVDNTLMLTTVDGKTEKILEADTITFLKLLISKGVRIRKPITSLVEFGDMIFNYPCIICKDSEVAEKVIESILELCHAWKNAGDNRLLSFGIKINRTNEEAVQLSFAGHIYDFVEVFDSIPQIGELKFEEWILLIYEKNNQFIEAKDNPDKFLLLHDDRLSFDRCFISPKYIEKIGKNQGIYDVKLSIPREDKTFLFEHKVIAAPVYKIKDSKCSKCGRKYRECGCIKFISSNVWDRVTDGEFLGMIWTNRSAFFTNESLHEVER